MRRGVALAAAAIAGLALSACETTAEKSARLARLGRVSLSHQHGLVVTTANPYVKVLSTSVVQDANGTAATVTLSSDASRPLINVPIAIDVLDGHGASLYANDVPGLEPSLTSAPVLAPHARFTWVDDQVQAPGPPAAVRARVGAAGFAPGALPRLAISGVSLYNDPASGLSARGTVSDLSPVAQNRLVVYAVARRAGRVVAAGRAILARVAAGKPVAFAVYFIGDPRGAKLGLSAPPTTLG